jgi:uncharacterized membrane protein YdcZ (DUF606 family)
MSSLFSPFSVLSFVNNCLIVGIFCLLCALFFVRRLVHSNEVFSFFIWFWAEGLLCILFVLCCDSIIEFGLFLVDASAISCDDGYGYHFFADVHGLFL